MVLELADNSIAVVVVKPLLREVLQKIACEPKLPMLFSTLLPAGKALNPVPLLEIWS